MASKIVFGKTAWGKKLLEEKNCLRNFQFNWFLCQMTISTNNASICFSRIFIILLSKNRVSNYRFNRYNINGIILDSSLFRKLALSAIFRNWNKMSKVGSWIPWICENSCRASVNFSAVTAIRLKSFSKERRILIPIWSLVPEMKGPKRDTTF